MKTGKKKEETKSLEELSSLLEESGRVLNGEELGMVSGGKGERPQDYEKCPYCHVSHPIVKEFPYTVKVRGTQYMNATKCICSSRVGNRIFYMVTLDTGEDVYVDDRFSRISKTPTF